MTKSKALSKEEFHLMPLARQQRLRNIKDVILAKLNANGILGDEESCKAYLQANTVAPKCCIQIFETYLNGVFDA